MRSTGECPKCGETKLWHVREMQDTTLLRNWPLGSIDDVAPLDTFICAGCEFTEWYSGAAGQLEPARGRVALVVDTSLACADCAGQPHLLLAELKEWPRDSMQAVPLRVLGERTGRFALLICAGCGRCQWFAWDLGEALAEEPPQAPCVRCGARQRRSVGKVLEDGGKPLPVNVTGERPVGHFAIDVCGGCGLTEWWARGTRKLRADGQRVLHIEGVRRARADAPTGGGPYR